MRKSILMICGLVLAVCLWLLLHRRAETPGAVSSPPAAAVATNQNPATAPQAVVTAPVPSFPGPVAVAPNTSTPATNASNASSSTIAEMWQKPIEFYGKVIDESSNPVAGASIGFRWDDLTAKDWTRTTTTTSDAEGLFSLHGGRGATLTVSVSKAGYYTSHTDVSSFHYAVPNDNHVYVPDQWNPAIFNLRKKGQGESLVSLKNNYGIPRDGTPVSIDLTTGATATSESGNFVVRCWTQDAGKRSGEKYDWRCVVTVPGGGAVTNSEDFAFQAPDGGYASSLEIAMPADRLDWKDDVDLRFFYRLADGRYGRMTFSMVAGGQHFCMIDSVLNPSGSRNLEPAQ